MQPATADGQPNVLDDLKIDHASFFSLYRRFKEELDLTPHAKQVLVWQLIHDLCIHSLAEEEAVYPCVTDTMGTKARDHALQEHMSLKHLLTDLDAMTIDSPGFEDKLELLMHALEHHIREEEEEMMPQLAAAVDRAKLAQLSHAFQASKRFVPTRPHLMAPDTPSGGNVLVNRLAAPIDKLRDLMRRPEVSSASAGAPGGAAEHGQQQ